MTNRALKIGAALMVLLAVVMFWAIARRPQAPEQATPSSVYDTEEYKSAARYCAEIPASQTTRTVECWVTWFPKVPRPILTEASRGNPAIGMPVDVLRRLLGPPHHVNQTTHAGGRSEQWVYGDRTYVYVQGGLVTSFQTTEGGR